MSGEDAESATLAGTPAGDGEEKHASADAVGDPMYTGPGGCSGTGQDVNGAGEITSSLSDAERTALFSSIEVSELQGATLIKAAMEQVEGIEEFADMESAVSALKDRERELEAAVEEQKEAVLVHSRELERLKTELIHAQEERDVEKKRLEARLERAERAHEENEKQQAYQLELAQSEVKQLNKQLEAAKMSMSQYSNAGMTPPGVRKMSRLSKSNAEAAAPAPSVTALVKEETAERRSSAPVPSRQGSSFDLLNDTSSKEESHTLKAMMRAQQSIVARKNIQISQLKSELTDAQRRLAVLESDPGASNANTLVYEQKYNDVKKQCAFLSYEYHLKLSRPSS